MDIHYACIITATKLSDRFAVSTNSTCMLFGIREIQWSETSAHEYQENFAIVLER